MNCRNTSLKYLIRNEFCSAVEKMFVQVSDWTQSEFTRTIESGRALDQHSFAIPPNLVEAPVAFSQILPIINLSHIGLLC